MAAPVVEFNFEFTRKCFSDLLDGAVNENNSDDCFKQVQEYNASNADKKSALDQAFRDVMRSLVVKNSNVDLFKVIVLQAINAVVTDLASASTPFLMLADVFNMVTIAKCEEIFDIIDENVLTWKSELLHEAGKNYLLRMCNDLLRRLSKSQNTVFCGKIQLFLSRLFPLSEKSALNLMGNFNMENVTTYTNTAASSSLPEVKEERMDIEEGEMEDQPRSIPIDYNLYKKFWSLQDFFRCPSQCFEKSKWKAFTQYSDEVLTAFSSAKLDNLKSSKKKLDRPQHSDLQSFFAKYLTSEKLLDLQLNDSNFRRYVLVQFLIIFQYFNLPVKFKNTSQALSDDQSNWTKNTQDKVYQLIRETPPDGDSFVKTVEHMLSREENWNSWKNEGCQSFEKNKTLDEPKKRRAKRRGVGDDLLASGGKITKMGNSELTNLWNFCPDNMEACKAKERVFLPTQEDYFEDAIEQSDPSDMVEEQYKSVNNENFQWKALRLLASRNERFFSQNHASIPAIPVNQYIESMLQKMVKEMPQTGNSEGVKTEIEEEESLKAEQEDETLRDNDEQAKEEALETVSDEQMEMIGERIKSDWTKLAIELNFSDEDIASLESKSDEVAERCVLMLITWKNKDMERSTAGALKIALREIGYASIAKEVFVETKPQ